MKSLFLVKKPKRSGHRNQLYTRDGRVHISSPEIYRKFIKNLSFK